MYHPPPQKKPRFLPFFLSPGYSLGSLQDAPIFGVHWVLQNITDLSVSRISLLGVPQEPLEFSEASPLVGPRTGSISKLKMSQLKSSQLSSTLLSLTQLISTQSILLVYLFAYPDLGSSSRREGIQQLIRHNVYSQGVFSWRKSHLFLLEKRASFSGLETFQPAV